MRIEYLFKIAPNDRKQVETKLNDEIKAGLLTKYEAEEPYGVIRISTYPWFDEAKYTGIISTEQGEAICSFTMDRNLNLSIDTLITEDFDLDM